MQAFFDGLEDKIDVIAVGVSALMVAALTLFALFFGGRAGMRGVKTIGR